eukprot:g5248.t1
METKHKPSHWWNQLIRKRNLVLSGLGIAALTAVLAASSDGFGQPEAKKEAAKAPASGPGLKGMLPDELPDALLAGAFDPLGKDYRAWSDQVMENLAKLYGEEPADAAGQRQALISLKGQIKTLETAMKRQENQKLQDVMLGIHGRLNRRADLFIAVLDTLEADPKTAHEAKIKSSGAAVLAALKDLRAVLQTYRNGLAWMGYVKSAEVTKAINAGDMTNPIFASVKQRLANRSSLSRSQSEFLGQKAFTTLESALGDLVAAANSSPKKVNTAALRAELKKLITAIEKYEATNSVTATRSVRAAFGKVRALAADDGTALADAMRSHYVNYNFRVYMSEQFMNRTIGETRTERRPVSDYILGASVSGNSVTSARVTIDLKENRNGAKMDIVLNGRVWSNTVGVTDQATVWTSGNHTFNARQGVIFDGDRLYKTGRPRIGVNANNTTTGISTKYSNFPILGSFAQRIASDKVAEKRGQSEAITRQKITDQVLPEFRKEVGETIDKTNKSLADRVISKLQEADLMPETRSVRSTDHYLLLSGRVMTPRELSGSTTNPTELPGPGLTVRFHESVMNNAVDKINLAGRKMTSEEIKEEVRNSISDFLGDNYDPELEKSGAQPMNKKKPSTDKFVFDANDPVRLRIRNGQLNVVIRCGLEQEGKKPIPTQIISVPLTFTMKKDEISVNRGTVSVVPAAPTNDRAEQLVRAGVMRKKIEEAIPNETRKRTITFGILPKEEIGALRLLKKNPEFDGRGTVVAVFDTGVDPGAAGLQTTSDGKPKIVDIVDGTGSGDVLMSAAVKPTDGHIEGTTGRRLKINPKWTNPTGTYRVGMKAAYALFPGPLVSRMKRERKKTFDAAQRKCVAELRRTIAAFDSAHPKPNAAQKQERGELQNRLDQLQAAGKSADPGPVYDCVVFHDGKAFRAVVDTDEDGDLTDETPLTNFRAERQFATFAHDTLMNFSVNIYENGKRLSLVTASGAHGTHVAGIIAANYPDRPEFNGVAPGAQIVSVKIGDSRLGGMETAAGLVRGLRTVIDNQCDLINMSYGEASSIPNHGRLISLFNEVVSKHGVIFVASAGNEGPALSTVGSPGGTTTDVIGVGAYVSPEMMAVEYTLRRKLPGLAYTWTSRGPTFDGDLGVNIFAPGGAISPVPTWTLQKNQRMNGTSMASPNCCGGIALLVSALKAQKIPYSPYSIHRAIANTAKRIESASAFAQGPGLLQVDLALPYLVKHHDCVGERQKFRVRVRGTHSGRGIYLREAHQTTRATAHTVSVRPLFSEKTKPETKTAFEMRISLSATEPWIQVGPHTLLTHGGSQFTVEVNPADVEPGAHFGEVRGFDADHPERGPIFRVPVTLIRSTPMKSETPLGHRETLTFDSGKLHRRFFVVPHGVEWADLTLRAKTSDGESRRFVLHTLKTHAGRSIDDVGVRRYVTLNHARDQVFSFAVEEGQSLEVCLAQYWSAVGETEVELALSFRGLDPDRRSLALSPGQPWARVEVTAATDREELEPKAVLKTHRTFYRPKSAVIRPLDAHRDQLPDGSPIYELLLTYEFDQPKTGSATPRFPAIDGILYDSPFGTHLWMLFDEKKKHVTTDDIWPDAITLRKGHYKLQVQLRHSKVKTLERHRKLLMAIDRPLAKSLSLGIYTSQIAAAERSAKFGSRKMQRGERAALTIAAPRLSSIPSSAIDGDLLIGTVHYGKSNATTAGPDQRPGGFPLQYSVAGTGRSREKASAKSKPAGGTLVKKIDSLKLAELERLAADGKTSKQFDALYDELVKTNGSGMKVLCARLQLLDHEKYRKTRLAEVVKAADAILEKIDAEKLALHFGRRVDPDDSRAVALRKTMERQRDLLTDTLYRKGRAIGYMELPEVLAQHPITDVKSHDTAFEDNFAELQKWVDTTDKKYVLLHGNFLIDTSPELRLQLLREDVRMVHSAIFTHSHADHIFGLDDLRIFGHYLDGPISLHCEANVEQQIRESFSYAFAPPHPDAHRFAIPKLQFERIGTDPFELLGQRVIPIRLMHGRLPILGFRIGDVAFCTDVSEIPDESWPKLEGLDVFIVDALRDRPHPTHFSIPQALAAENLVAVNQNEPPIVDNDYRFQLKSPSRKWKLLPLDQAQGLLADASAGMVRMGLPGDGAAYGLVVVEPIGDTNLSAYSELLKDSFTDAGHQLKPPEHYEVAGKPAVRYRSILQTNGLKFEYSLIGFVHQRHGYQLLMWAPLNTLNANLTSEFVGAFSLLDGKVRGRANARKLVGFRAVGKRVVDGRYESPVSRLIVEPRKPWHLLVGSTLTQLNAEADVGMQNDLASAYLVIVPERIVGLDVGKYTKQVQETFAGALAEEGSSTKHLDPLKMTIDGVEVEFARYVAGKSLRFEYSHCVCVRDGWAYQITVWWLENRRQHAKQLLADAMSGIRFLTPPQAQALEKELLALPDPENAVGPGWGIRRGVYRDFNLGMIWKKPVGFWRVLAGDDAANFSEDSRVWASENRLGLTLDISAKPADGRSLMKVHQDVAKLYFAADAKSVVKPARIEIDGRPALLSIEDQVVDRLALKWLNLRGTRITDTGLAHLKEKTQLKWLDISGTRINDAGLAHLKGMTKLEWLDLNETRITNAGLVYLREMTKLEMLDLSSTKITDGGLVNLKRMTKLGSLYLADTRITDAGLVHLKGLTELTGLELSETRIANAGLVHLKGMTKLQSLYLSQTKVSDAGLKHLKGLTKLDDLILSRTRITDAGLVHLKGLINLVDLLIIDTKVTAAGADKLEAALPKCTITM